MRWLPAAALVLAACSPAPDSQAPDPGPRDPATLDEPTTAQPQTPPGVTLAADPPPPFTYWAPEGSTVRNHANPGQWIAEKDGRQVATYFGDGCGASALQGWVGKPWQDMPTPPPNLYRPFASGSPILHDLRPDRVNIEYDPATGLIVRIDCF